jgi:hypothetical protein
MYRAYLAQSQVFVGIYWQRYGWVAPGMQISGLEDEFRLAAGKPKLLYLKRPAPDLEPRLAAMIDGIRAAGTVSCRTFATPGELERPGEGTCSPPLINARNGGFRVRQACGPAGLYLAPHAGSGRGALAAYCADEGEESGGGFREH